MHRCSPQTSSTIKASKRPGRRSRLLGELHLNIADEPATAAVDKTATRNRLWQLRDQLDRVARGSRGWAQNRYQDIVNVNTAAGFAAAGTDAGEASPVKHTGTAR